MGFTFITGATGVLGSEFALEYAKRGENLFLTGRSEQKFADLAIKLQEYNVSVQYFKCELSLEQSVGELKGKLLESDCQIDRAILVAGNDNQMALADYKEEQLIRQIRVNYEAPLVLTKFLLDNFNIKQILAVSSLTCILPMPYFAVYSSAKRGLRDFFLAIKREYKHVKISVVCPGSIPTREDVVADIKKQGITGKLSSVDKQKVVYKSIKGLEKGKSIIITGGYNKFVNFISKFVPLKLKQKIIEKKFKNKRKENFI